MKGRRRILADYEAIDAENVVRVLQEDALPVHAANAAQTQYLWDYYRGQQPILKRVKDVRPEINNRIVENHAQEIVAFKIGYQLAEPMQYTCRTYASDADGTDASLEDINELNTLMFAEDKASHDRDLFEWMLVCGVGYRMAEADSEDDFEEGGAPFEIHTLDPRTTFLVRSSAYHRKPLMAVWIGRDPDDEEPIYNCFTKSACYRVKGGAVIEKAPHTYGCIPIVEYQLNNARMGVFEPVLALLDAINAVESNRIDGIEQTVQALMKFVNCDVTEAKFESMLKLGAVSVATTEGTVGEADVDIIKNDLDQTSTQTTKDDLYQAIVNICGMPNRNGTSGSSSDTGAAVLLRDGWTLAESHAKSYELQMKRSERDFLRCVLSICAQSAGCDIDLRIRDIELAFNRRNYENIATKSQVLTGMLGCSSVHPRLAFEACGMFSDPEAAWLESKAWQEEQRAEALAALPDELAENAVGAMAGKQPQGDDDDGQDGAGQSQAGQPEPEKGDDAGKPASGI